MKHQGRMLGGTGPKLLAAGLILMGTGSAAADARGLWWAASQGAGNHPTG